MAKTYHVPQTRDRSREIRSSEDVARNALRSRPKSNLGAWVLTLAAIAIGAIGGTHLSQHSTNDMLALFDINPMVEPASGVNATAQNRVSFQAAGDGLFYSDVEIGGRIFTMQIDPTQPASLLSAHDMAALNPLAETAGDVITLPSVEIAKIRIDRAAFLIDERNRLFSVIGLDLLSQLGHVDWTGPELHVARGPHAG